jgi:hypothetical protein
MTLHKLFLDSEQCANTDHQGSCVRHNQFFIGQRSSIAVSSFAAGDIRNAEATSITAPHTENQIKS